MARITPEASWRDSARLTRFFIIDYRAAFPFLLFLLHIRWWTFLIALVTVIFLAILERYGFTVTVFARLFRSILAGSRKTSIPWWKT
jgi:intracellular multiplication protein IcmT